MDDLFQPGLSGQLRQGGAVQPLAQDDATEHSPIPGKHLGTEHPNARWLRSEINAAGGLRRAKILKLSRAGRSQ